ncbi:MAG: hypothetical protein OXQ94_00395 [Gemmatimonadota bacterium]|nr:hypothetical protein [Gemmatimonadota bacterium]
MKIRPLVSLALFGAAACQPDKQSRSGPATETRDSAGIRIVENAKPQEGSRVWRVASEPAVSIGEHEGEDPYLLYQVWDATKLPDGRIVVANSGDGQLRVFDANGIHLETWGGRGEGPGELPELIHVEPWRGDSIAAWFGPRRGITLFGPDGSFGRNIFLEVDSQDPMAVFIQPGEVMAGGLILAGQHPHVRDPVVVEIRDAEGGLLSSLGRHSGDERYIINEGTDQARGGQPIFGAMAMQVPWGDLVVHNLNNRYEIRAFAHDGSLARIVRRDHASQAPTGEEIDAYIEERASWHPVDLSPDEIEEYKAERRKELQSIPVAERIPAFTTIKVDRLDHLWVQEYEPPGQERPGSLWTVFDPEGRVLGFVETPDGLDIFEIGEDYVLGQSSDEMNVEFVQVWPLER